VRLSVLGEQKADGYLRGQIWNRDEEEKQAKPYIFVSSPWAWATGGESVPFVIRRRFKDSDRGKKDRSALTVVVEQGWTFQLNTSTQQLFYSTVSYLIPGGSGDLSINIAAPTGVPPGANIVLLDAKASKKYKLIASGYGSFNSTRAVALYPVVISDPRTIPSQQWQELPGYTF
jgi:hypothetical protein